MPSFFAYLAVAQGATTALALPTTSNPAINRTRLASRQNGGQNYYDLGLAMPLCVPVTDPNLCTLTIVGMNGLPDAWVYLFDSNCNLDGLDSEVDWNALGAGTYVINSLQLVLPVTVHSQQDVFMQNYIDDDFWVEFSGSQQYFNQDQSFWDNGWSGGEATNGYEIKRMNFICQ